MTLGKEELVWYLAQRTGVGLEQSTPQDLAAEIFKRPSEELRAMRAGAYFVVVDEYSESSDIYKMLTETNIAVPIDQFFRADDGNTCLRADAPPLSESLRRFVTEERKSQDFKAGRKAFASALSLGMVSMMQNLLVLGATAKESYAAVGVALKSITARPAQIRVPLFAARTLKFHRSVPGHSIVAVRN